MKANDLKTALLAEDHRCNPAPRLGFIGLGEVSYYLIKGLKKDGVDVCNVYSRSVLKPESLKKAAAKAAEIGADLSYDLAELIRKSDIVFSTVRGHVALETSKKAAQYIKPGQIYVDLNNTIPAVKEEASQLIMARGAKFVDIGLLELPIQLEHKALMYASGSAAAEFKERMSPFGMNIRVIPGGVGQAAKMKALVNIYMKCIQGVCLEFAISAKSAGIALEDLEPLLTKPVRDIPREKDVGFWIIRGALLAERKKEEMKEALKMMADLKIEPVMLNAAIERLERVSRFHLKEDFDASIPCGEYERIIERMFEIGKEDNIDVR